MKEEKENLILKFFGYFVGPVQFVMEVRSPRLGVSTQRCGAETKRLPHVFLASDC